MALHPDIRKFWENQGYYKIREVEWGYGRIIGWANTSENGRERGHIIYMVEDGVFTHYIAGGTYYEPEALRVIKLAAFL